MYNLVLIYHQLICAYMQLTDILLISLLIVSIITLAINSFDTYFRVKFANTQIAIQKKEAEEFEKLKSEAESEQELIKTAETSDHFRSMGLKSSAVRQEQALESAMGKEIMNTEEVEMAMEVLKMKYPEVYKKVKENPRLVPKAISLFKKYSEMTPNALTPSNNNNQVKRHVRSNYG